MKGKRIYLAAVILVMLICLVILWKMGTDNKEAFTKDDISITTADIFLRALTEKNIDKAIELSAGHIKSNILSNKDDRESKYEVVSINLEIESRSDDLSIINSIIESKNKETGEIDVNFLKIYMIKAKDNKFKIYRIEETDPILGQSMENNNLDGIEDIFISYVKHLSKKDYIKAGKLLIGRANKIHNQTMKLIKDTKLIDNPEDFTMKVVFRDQNNVITNCSYLNNDRKITVVISLYKTSEGWKIYNVSSI